LLEFDLKNCQIANLLVLNKNK